MTKLHVLIVDDHEIMRAGIRALLVEESDFDICGEANNGREAVALAKQLKPDIIVLDITMPELNGLEAARQILKAVPCARVLILSMHESEELIRDIVKIGAHGYILKSDAGHELVAGVRALGQGRPYFASKIAQLVLRAYLSKPSGGDGQETSDTLTSREREILQLLAEGKSNKEVASILTISVLTVETHRAHIMQKLGARSVAELVLHAVRHKMIMP